MQVLTLKTLPINVNSLPADSSVYVHYSIQHLNTLNPVSELFSIC